MLIMNLSSKASARNAVKFPSPQGIGDVTGREAILNVISNIVPADHILGAMYHDGYLNIYLATREDMKLLLVQGIVHNGKHLSAFPLVCAFTIKNVSPTIKDDELSCLFTNTGGIVDTEVVPFCPGSSKFSHVLGGERRIYVELNKHNHVPKLSEFIKLHGVTCIVSCHCVLCEVDGHVYNKSCKIKKEPIGDSNEHTSSTTQPQESNNQSADRAELENTCGNSPIYISEDVFQYLPRASLNSEVLENGNDISLSRSSDHKKRSLVSDSSSSSSNEESVKRPQPVLKLTKLPIMSCVKDKLGDIVQKQKK